MQCVTKFLKARVFLTLACALTVLLPGTCIAESTATRMQKVVEKFVKQTGNEVVGLGSWIRGGQYRDVLTFGDVAKASDHDLRLVLRNCSSENTAAVKWLEGRKEFIRLVNAEFGSDARLVLEKTNLYAPSQLMTAVQDTEDATRLFVRHNQVPNLGYQGAVTVDTPKKFTEGLFGDGAAAWTQEYEADFGTRFYKSGDSVFSGSTKGLHAAEGKKLLSSTGAANVSRQWVAHAAECIETGDGKSLGKYLERIERDLTRSKGLIHAAADGAWQTEIRTLATQLKSNPSSLSVLEHRVAQVLQRASVESEILARIKGSTPARQAVLRAILNSIQQGDELGRKILNAAAKVPAATIFEALGYAFGAYEAGSAYNEGDYTAALAAAALTIDPTLIGVLLQITHLSIESARDAGASLVGNRQDCGDLMEGIFNGGVIEVDGKRYTHEQLFESLKSEEQLSSFVFSRATKASIRQLGEAANKTDERTAQAKFDKCYPVILNVWKLRRDRLEAEYNSLFDEVVDTPPILIYRPKPLRLDSRTNKAIATVSVKEPQEVLSKIHRMKIIANELTGEWPSLTLVYRWSPGYTSPDGKEQNTYEYDAPGFYKVGVKRQVISVAKGRKASVKLDKTEESSEDIEVVVEGREADGTYEGKMLMTSLRIINEEGVTTQVDLSKSPEPPIPFELVIEGESATIRCMSVNKPFLPNDTRLSGEFNPANKGIFVDVLKDKKLIGDIQVGKDGIKKYENRIEGRLIGADSAEGKYTIYAAYEGDEVVPIDSEGNTKIEHRKLFFHVAGRWKAKLRTELPQPKPSSSGSALKSKKTNPSNTATAPKSGKK
jgi:hypothetical protein